MKRLLLFLFLLGTIMPSFSNPSPENSKPLQIGIAGLTHSHVHGILGRKDRGDIKIVGIAEPNRELAQRFANQYGFSMDIVYDSIEKMVQATNPEAVTAFNSIFEHLETVEICAPRGVHVMVEKPLAVNMEHATKMASLAKEHNIQLLTNYETTWYATNHKTYDWIHKQDAIGNIRKIVVHDGHQGPKEIGVNDEFLEWLTDPVMNGGGAVIDFGCYGANLITWLMQGERPESVTAVLQTDKPDIYAHVDDEATIVVKYPKTQGIIQASWNWPFSRKDMHVYGQTGYIYADNRTDMRYRFEENQAEQSMTLEERKPPFDDPFAYLAAVLKGNISPQPYDLSSLENNMIVVEILSAAIESARTGCTVELEAK